uniref:Uncharacterized protein n=1 Tax=Anguilla anguilla TaxID=7936 RepID=A0A0E9S6S1_ANGAN
MLSIILNNTHMPNKARPPESVRIKSNLCFFVLLFKHNYVSSKLTYILNARCQIKHIPSHRQSINPRQDVFLHNVHICTA